MMIEVLVGELRCAVPLDHAVEVLPRVEITRLPGLPPPLVGHLRHRGEVVPVLDLRARLDREPRVEPIDEHVLVLRTRPTGGPHRRLALLVDRVVGVAEVAVGDAGPPGPGVPAVTAMRSLPDGMLLLMDPDQLLTPDEDAAIRSALDQEGA